MEGVHVVRVTEAPPVIPFDDLVPWVLAFNNRVQAVATGLCRRYDFDVVLATGVRDPIPDQWELGFSFGKVGKPLRLWWLSFDRFGVAYRASSGGDLEGIGLVFRSLFDR